jgi:hypothetical protein
MIFFMLADLVVQDQQERHAVSDDDVPLGCCLVSE